MKEIRKKITLCIASLMMVFTSVFSNFVMPVHAADEKVFFTVNKADEVINEAKKHVGKPYVWGANGPNSFDCSGFVSYVLKQTGLSLGADRITTYTAIDFLNGKGVTSYQYPTNEGSPSNAQKGDLVFYYDETGDPIHMGIYMGNGQIIHCAASMPTGPQNQVMISNVDDLGTKHDSSLVSYRVFRTFPQSGGFTIKKTNEKGEPLAGVVFEITLPNGTKRNVTTGSNGLWDSDKAGLQLKEGTYKVKEISTVEGYLLDSTVKSVEVKAGQKASANVISFTNKVPTGEITLTKYNEDKSSTLAGTKYHVTSNVGYEKDVTTNANGVIHLTGLKLGTYTFTETQAPHGFLLNKKPITITLAYRDQHTTVIVRTAEQTNKEPRGEITLLKYNEDKSGVVPETTYRLSGPNGYDKTHTTNDDGKIILKNLKLGEYTFVEEKAGDGYLINTTPIKVTLSYKDQHTEIITGNAEQTNKEPTAKVKLKKEDKETGETPQGDATLSNATYNLVAAEDIYNKAERLKKISHNTFCIRDHDSLHISNGLWNWQSMGIGGRSALDFLIKVDGYSFMEAAEIIATNLSLKEPKYIPYSKKERDRKLQKPLPEKDNQMAINYLLSRGISYDVIHYCITRYLIYQSVYHNLETDKTFNNVAFVGYEKETQKMRHIALRGINNNFIGDAAGSDKRFSFYIESENPNCNIVHVCEAPIDVLSQATLFTLENKMFNQDHILSLTGVYCPKNENKEIKIPVALNQFLIDHPIVDNIIFHLDLDCTGRMATKLIIENMKIKMPTYKCYDEPPQHYKDINDSLCIRLGLPRSKPRVKKTKDFDKIELF